VVLTRNYRCPEGEIDLVVRDPEGVLCFVEVRSRRSASHGDPLETVTPAKQRRLALAARRYLAELDGGADLPTTRFDVVGVVREPSPRISWARAAFEPPWTW